MIKNRITSSFAIVLLLVSILSYTNEITAQNAPEASTSKSILNAMKQIENQPIEDQIALFHRLKREEPSGYNFDVEDQLNIYGYDLLWSGNTQAAIQVFKLVVEEFPMSSNAYDSLGEAYMSNGDTTLAIVNYSKTLAMNSDNFYAEDQLFLLKNPGAKLDTPQEKYDKTYTISAYKNDLTQLGETLEKLHPNVYKFISKEEFWKTIEAAKSKLTTKTTYQEFLWYCNEIVSNVNCSHTGLSRFFHENEIIPPVHQFPLQVRWIDDRMYITDTWDNKSLVSIKDEITRINGIEVTDLINDIYKHIPSQGYITTAKNHLFNSWAHTLISFTLNMPKEYTISVKGNATPIRLKPNTKHRRANFGSTIPSCGEELCLEFFDNDESAILTVSSFVYYYWNRYAEFEHFMNLGFEKIAEKGVKNLIIDLRYNGGGSPESSIHLLRYLMDKPFTYYSRAEYPEKKEKHEGEGIFQPFDNRFKGNCYFLIDGQGNSTTGHFMSLAKVHNLGTIIGEELGSNQFCSAGQKRCRLRNTKITFNVANNTHMTTATSLPDEVGILPNEVVFQSIDDVLSKKDVVKERALHLIGSNQGVREIISSNNIIATPDFTWGKEIIKFPIHFAQDINYSGIEELQFPKGWSDNQSDDYWSYAFVWKIAGENPIALTQLESDLQYYFDGLMKINNRTPDDSFTKTKVNLKKAKVGSEGEVFTIDNFFTKAPMTLYVTVTQSICKKSGLNYIFFRMSPKGQDHKIWNKLNSLGLQSNYCK